MFVERASNFAILFVSERLFNFVNISSRAEFPDLVASLCHSESLDAVVFASATDEAKINEVTCNIEKVDVHAHLQVFHLCQRLLSTCMFEKTNSVFTVSLKLELNS